MLTIVNIFQDDLDLQTCSVSMVSTNKSELMHQNVMSQFLVKCLDNQEIRN